MAKDPADRYVTAAELAEDLRRFLSGEPIQAQRPSLGVRLRSWITRHRLLSLFTVVTAVAAPGMLSLLVWSTSEAQRRSRAESENRRLSRATSVYRLQQAVARLKDHKVGEARELLRAIEEYPGDFDLNSFAWRRVRNWADRVIVPVSTEPINHAAPSPDGKYLIGLKASDNIFEPIHVIERSTLRPVRTTPNPGVPLGYVPQFSPDGRLMAGIESPAVPNQPHRVFVWEIEGGRLLAETRVPAGARASTPVMVADDMVVIEEFPKVGAKSTLRLWQIQSERRELRIVRTITDKAYRWFVARDGRTAGYLENVGDGSRLMLADLLNGSTRELSGASQPQRKITQARLSHDGSLLILHVHSEIQFWETATGREIARYDVGHFAYWGQVSLNPDARAATVWDPGALTLTIWDRDRGRSHVLRPRVNPGKANLSVSFTPDGTRIAVWLAESTDPEALTVWDVATGNRLAVAPSDALPLRTLRFAPDGREIIIVRDPTAMVWRLDPDAPTKLAGHGDEAWAVAFSRAGDLLASGCDDEGGDETNTIKLWDPKNGRLLRGWSGGVGTVSSVAFAPDGLTLASAHFDEPGSVRLWDVATGKLLASLEGHTAKARSVAFHPSGRWLASASSDRTVRIWDVAARRCVHVLQGHQKTIQEVAFSPDGKKLATAGDDGTVRLWDFASGKPTQALQGGKIMSVAFSSDGTLLAAAEASGQVRLWNTETGTARATLNCGHTILHALAFSPRGETLAVADMSGRIQLWDIPSLQELFSLQDEGPQINGLAFSPDGTTIAGASHDGTVRLWR
jgi:WD40 repeat protein